MFRFMFVARNPKEIRQQTETGEEFSLILKPQVGDRSKVYVTHLADTEIEDPQGFLIAILSSRGLVIDKPMPSADVAARLGLPETEVRTKLEEALARIIEMLSS